MPEEWAPPSPDALAEQVTSRRQAPEALMQSAMRDIYAETVFDHGHDPLAARQARDE